MKTPLIHHYLETLSNPAGRFRSLTGIGIVRDSRGNACYAVRSKTLDVLVRHQESERILSCPLRHEESFDLAGYVRARYAGNAPVDTTRLLLREMLVFNDRGESDWFDVLLTAAPGESFLRQKNRSESAPPESLPPEDFPFFEGLAAAEREGRYGYIDPDGKTAIPFRYDWADDFDEGLAVVRLGESFGLVDKQGNEVFAPEHEDIRWHPDNGVVLLCDEGVWSLRDRRGEPVGGNTFDFISDFSKGLASVRRGDKYGYIDRNGEIVIPLLYEEAYSFSEEGLATVVKNGISFCIDTEGMVFD